MRYAASINTRRGFFAVLLVALALLAFPTPSIANAQDAEEVIIEEAEFESARWYGGMGSRDIEDLVRLTSMSDEQKVAARELFGGYRKRVAASQKKLADYTSGFQSEYASDPAGTQKKMMDAHEKFREYCVKISGELQGDLRLLLTDAQLEAWPRYERNIRRRNMLPQIMRLSGGRFDVSENIAKVVGKDPMSDELSALIEQYEFAIDAPVREIESLQKEMMDLYRNRTPGDYEQLENEPLMQKASAVYRQARDVNIRFARKAHTLLDEKQRNIFDDALVGSRFDVWASYSDRAGNSTLSGVMNRLEYVDDLSEDQRSHVKMLKEDFASRNREVQRRIFNAHLKLEEGLNVFSSSIWRTPATSEELTAASEDAKQLVERYAEAAREFLTSEQIDKLGAPFRKVIEQKELIFDD